MKRYLHWTRVIPVLAWLLYFSHAIPGNAWLQWLAGVLLAFSVVAAVHHSEIVAHRVGEPFGTIILAVAITVIEVAIIISLMLVQGQDSATLARDTVFAATMLILNGIIGTCLLVGALKHREQFFSEHSATAALVSLIAIIVFTLILPNYTTSVAGPMYTKVQLILVSLACLVIYGTFLLIQTVRHRDYFLAQNDGEEAPHPVSNAEALSSLLFLLVSLGIVVMLAKSLSPPIENFLNRAGLPQSLLGVIIAMLILLPEGLAAIKAARANQLQTSLNLALGSALASIGLTVPTVAIVSSAYDLELIMGLEQKSILLLALSVFIVMLSLGKGKTNILYGVVLLVNLAAYLFINIFP
jgi:Ca2+:H+ antiporter